MEAEKLEAERIEVARLEVARLEAEQVAQVDKAADAEDEPITPDAFHGHVYEGDESGIVEEIEEPGTVDQSFAPEHVISVGASGTVHASGGLHSAAPDDAITTHLDLNHETTPLEAAEQKGARVPESAASSTAGAADDDEEDDEGGGEGGGDVMSPSMSSVTASMTTADAGAASQSTATRGANLHRGHNSSPLAAVNDDADTLSSVTASVDPRHQRDDDNDDGDDDDDNDDDGAPLHAENDRSNSRSPHRNNRGNARAGENASANNEGCSSSASGGGGSGGESGEASHHDQPNIMGEEEVISDASADESDLDADNTSGDSVADLPPDSCGPKEGGTTEVEGDYQSDYDTAQAQDRGHNNQFNGGHSGRVSFAAGVGSREISDNDDEEARSQEKRTVGEVSRSAASSGRYIEEGDEDGEGSVCGSVSTMSSATSQGLTVDSTAFATSSCSSSGGHSRHRQPPVGSRRNGHSASNRSSDRSTGTGSLGDDGTGAGSDDNGGNDDDDDRDDDHDADAASGAGSGSDDGSADGALSGNRRGRSTGGSVDSGTDTLTTATDTLATLVSIPTSAAAAAAAAADGATSNGGSSSSSGTSALQARALEALEASGDETFEAMDSHGGGAVKLGGANRDAVERGDQGMEAQPSSCEHTRSAGNEVILDDEQSDALQSEGQPNDPDETQPPEKAYSSPPCADDKKEEDTSEPREEAETVVDAQNSRGGNNDYDGNGRTPGSLPEPNPMDESGYSDDDDAFEVDESESDDNAERSAEEEGDEWDELPTNRVCFQV